MAFILLTFGFLGGHKLLPCAWVGVSCNLLGTLAAEHCRVPRRTVGLILPADRLLCTFPWSGGR